MMKPIALAILGLATTSALADTVVKIGFAGPLTGPLAHIGKDEEYGTKLALEDINAKGLTLAGQKVRFELMSEDDQADPRQATVVAQRLVDAKVAGVVGHVTSGAAIPASQIYNQGGVPVVTPSATNPRLTQQGFKVTYRLIGNDFQQGERMGEFAAKKLNVKNVAIIDDRTAYGQGLADAFADNLKKLGIKVVGREYTNDKAVDFKPILTRLKSKKPDAIFYGGMDAQGAPMLKQIKELGLDVKFLSGDGTCTDKMLDLASVALNSNVYCTQAGIPMEKMPGGAQFKQRFTQTFKTDVQLYAPYSYDSAMSMIEAMKLANSADPAKYLPMMQKVNFKGITGNISFDAKGDNKEGAATLYQFANGKWQPL